MSGRLLWLSVILPLGCLAQGPATQVYVVATKTSFIWGEAIKVQASVRDAQGAERTQDPVTWTVVPDAAASVAADGTVTPRQMIDFIVRARSGNLQGEVLMQALPKKIVLTPENANITVGETQKITASVLDVNDRAIPGVALKWDLRNAGGNWDRNNPMAEIDSIGRLHSLIAGQLRVTAYVDYGFSPWLLSQFEGDTYIQIKPPQTYKFERVFRATATGASSTLAAQPSALLATDNGFDFVASLDGLSSAVLEWSPDGITPIALPGRAHASSGQPLIQISQIARNHNGEILCDETDARGTPQISLGPAGDVQPLLVPNTPLNGAERTGFGFKRNSIADSGMKVFSVSYADAVTHGQANGLYRGPGRGLSESVVNSIDGLPGFPGRPFTIGWYGIADDGAVWFFADVSGPFTRVLFRAPYGGPPEKVLQDGDTLQDLSITNSSPFTFNPNESRFFAATNGDLVMGVSATREGAFLRWSAADGFKTPDVLTAPATGVFWYEPGVGALLDTRYGGSGQGLYLWNAPAVSPVLLLGDSTIDGSPVREIFSATASRSGVIYAMIRSDANAMLIVRLAPDRQIILKIGDSVPAGSVPVVNAMLRGRRDGPPLVLTGGQPGSIARLADDGRSLQPIVRIGDPLPGGKSFLGSMLTYDRWQAQSAAGGGIIFSDSTGIYGWNAGAIDVVLQSPVPAAGSLLYFSPWAFSVNSQGDIALNTGAAIYFIHNGTAVKVMDSNDRLDGATVTHESSPVIDDSGRIAFRISTGDGGKYSIALWDGATTQVIFGFDQIMPDGRSAKTGGTLAGGGFPLAITVSVADGQGTLAKYVDNIWQYVAGKDDRTATGSFVRFNGLMDVNAAGDVVFESTGAPYTDDIGVKRGNTFHAIHSTGSLTSEGDLLMGINQLLIQDDGTAYVLAVNDQGQQVIYRASPLR